MLFYFRDTGLSAIIDNQISVKTVCGNTYQEIYTNQPTTTFTFYLYMRSKGKQFECVRFLHTTCSTLDFSQAPPLEIEAIQEEEGIGGTL
jgi:hypothetical protein